ncbi:glycosyltransferase family 4 protein [Salegentibacter sp. HM20]
MKLLYITNGITGSGGLERVLSIKASLLVDQYDYEIAIVSLNEKKLSPFYSFNNKINFYDITVPKALFLNLTAYIRGLRKIVRDFKPDVISVCDDGLKGFFLPKILGKQVPIIYERHVSKEIEMRDNFPFWKKQLIRAKWKIMEKLAPGFSKFVILTEGNSMEWPSLTNLKIIPNPLPFYPENSSSLNNKKVLIVGKQSYQKGQDLLIQAWKIVMEKHPDWVLEIVGKVDESMGLKQQLSKLDLAEQVHFFEPEKNIEQKYSNTSIYVMSSRYEGFGMVLIEAMAFGVPCISFNCNYGPSDIIKHNQNGLLIPNGDINSLAMSIIELIENPERRKALGLQAKIDAQKYLPEQIVKQWDDLFRLIT